MKTKKDKEEEWLVCEYRFSNKTKNQTKKKNNFLFDVRTLYSKHFSLSMCVMCMCSALKQKIIKKKRKWQYITAAVCNKISLINTL